MLHQNKGGIGKSIRDAQKISQDPIDVPRDLYASICRILSRETFTHFGLTLAWIFLKIKKVQFFLWIGQDTPPPYVEFFHNPSVFTL